MLGHIAACSVNDLALTNSTTTYPKGIWSFWHNSSLPAVESFLQLLLHQYNVAWLMQPTAHDVLQKIQGSVGAKMFTT